MFWFCLFLGLVQGVAEFLPISSSGHLALFQNIYTHFAPDGTGFDAANQPLFNAMLHLGTLVSVCIVYRKDIWEMILELGRFFRDLFRRKTSFKVPEARRMLLLIIIACLPLLVIYPFKDSIEGLQGNNAFVGCALLVTGLLLFIADRIPKGTKSVRSSKVTDVLLVGAAQAIATVPGLSRSGTTISTGLFLKFERGFAVRFSFLMSLPPVIMVALLGVIDTVKEPEALDPGMLPAYIAATALAAVVGVFAISLLNRLVKKGRFGGFAYYCWGVGILSIVLAFALQ